MRWLRGLNCRDHFYLKIKSSVYFVSLFVCLRLFVPLENFSPIWRHHLAGEGLQILSYSRHSWPLSSEGSLACHIYCDTGHPFLMVISKEPVTLEPIAERLTVELSLPFFYDIGLSRLRFEHPTFCMRDERSNPLCQRRG